MKLSEVKSDLRYGADIQFAYSDVQTDELERLKQVQLYDTQLWKKFVELFRQDGADDPNYGWRCEYWGKMMRGACFTYAAGLNKDEHLYTVLEETCRDMLTTQDSLGRFSTYSVEKEFHSWDIWGRKYIMLGFLYFLEICKNDKLTKRILEAVKQHADYMILKLGEREGQISIADRGEWDGLNNCSILEPFVLLYNVTKEERYLNFSKYIVSFGGTLHSNLFELAYEDKLPVYEYPITKAYEMISCFDGLAEYAKITGDEKLKQTVLRFADNVLQNERTIIGCLGCKDELFDHASATQFDETRVGIMLETCVTVTWMKFMWQVYRMTGNKKYMDEFEISMYNAMSASLRRHINPEENGGILLPIHSYNPLRHSIRWELVGGQQFINENSLYGCCVCISSAGFALESIASAAMDTDGAVYINLYRNGKIVAEGIEIEITTGYPYSKDGSIVFRVNKCTAERTIYLRLPFWSKNNIFVLENHTKQMACKLSGYAKFQVSEGSVFTYIPDMTPRLIQPSDYVSDTTVNDYFAVRRGPLTYALDETMESEPVFEIENRAIENAVVCDCVETECHTALEFVTVDGHKITLVDYASAGQEEGHKVCAWMRRRNVSVG